MTNKLSHIKFDIAYASTSKRAIETIKPLCLLNHLSIIQDKDLCEMYFGIYDGFTWENVNKLDISIHERHLKTNEITGIPKQENTQQVANRMYNIIKKIAMKNIGKRILIASHGVAIEAFLRKITKVPFIEQREEYSQRNTSINQIIFNEKNKFELIDLNNVKHLK